MFRAGETRERCGPEPWQSSGRMFGGDMAQRTDWPVVAFWVSILGADLIALWLFIKAASVAWRYLS